jgi:DNA protecting protein DprA
MNYKLNSDQGLIFLTYLTKYNIKLMNEILEEAKNELVSDYISKATTYYSWNRFNDQPDFKLALEDAELCIDKLNYYKIKTESIFSKNYPARLRKLQDPPPVLYYKGAPLRKKKLVAMVGTRDASKLAERVIDILVEVFARNDYGIVSGLAIGIDSMAHRSTIQSRGYTVAVMAGSLNDIYPKQNFRLANEIIDTGGTLVSELPFGISHGKKSFIMRNRIQAGISDCVMPIEMGIKSGTMSTVEFAYAQGKYIFLVPPTPAYSKLPQYEGINFFISKSKEEKYKKTFIVNDIQNLEDFLQTDVYTQQIKLFDDKLL